MREGLEDDAQAEKLVGQQRQKKASSLIHALQNLFFKCLSLELVMILLFFILLLLVFFFILPSFLLFLFLLLLALIVLFLKLLTLFFIGCFLLLFLGLPQLLECLLGMSFSIIHAVCDQDIVEDGAGFHLKSFQFF